MSYLRRHSNSVIKNEQSCPDRHEEGFSELGAYYNQYADDLVRDLTSDIQPEQIVPGGESLGIALEHPDGIYYIGDPGYTTATLERWAMTEDFIVRISKSASWHDFGPMTDKLFKQIRDRRSIIPGAKKRRTESIANEIIAASQGICVDEFQIPEVEVTDDVIYEMRLAADALFSQSLLRPTHRTIIDPNLLHLPSELSLRSKAYESAKSRLVYSAASKEVGRPKPVTELKADAVVNRVLQLNAARAKYEHTIEPKLDDIERSREYLVHDQLHDLIIATKSLKRAVYAIRDGQVIMPTRPQDTAPRYVSLLSVSGKGSKSLEFDNGSSITLTIN